MNEKLSLILSQLKFSLDVKVIVPLHAVVRNNRDPMHAFPNERNHLAKQQYGITTRILALIQLEH